MTVTNGVECPFTSVSSEVVVGDVVVPRGGGLSEGQWVPVADVRRLEGELERVRGQLDTARVDVTTSQDATRAAEGRARMAWETVERMRVEDVDRNAAAREWADDNNLCSQFERFCEAYGWEGRTSEYEVTVRVTADVTVMVEAPRDSDSSDLSDRIDEDEVRSQVRGGSYEVVSSEVYDYTS